MSEITSEAVVGGRKITAHFTRKVSDSNYGSTEAGIYVEGRVEDDASDVAIYDEAARLWKAAKASVLDELGIEMTTDEATGIVRESLTPYVSSAQAEQAVKRNNPGTKREPKAAAGGYQVWSGPPANKGGKWLAFDKPDWVDSDDADGDRFFKQTDRDSGEVVSYKAAKSERMFYAEAY